MKKPATVKNAAPVPRAKSVRAWQRMLSGRRLDLLDPSPLDVELEDIAHGLARVARWNGQTKGAHIFSVAQHVLLVEALARAQSADLDDRMRLAILLHDAAEWGDVLPIWQRWAQFFGRPALFHDGSAAADGEAASAKPVRPRRPAARLAKRRARRMWRSRQVRLGPPANVFTGARELISYE